MSKALMSPWQMLSANTHGIVMCPERVNAASASDCTNGQRLRPHQHLLAVEPVNPDAGKRGEKKRGDSGRRS